MLRISALQAPPNVVRDVLAWATKDIASTLLGSAQARHDRMLAMSKEKGIGRGMKQQYVEKAKAAKALVDEIKKHAKKAQEEQPASFTTLKLDLTGWRYPKPERAPKNLMVFVYYADPSVKFGAANFMPGDPKGDTIGVISIYASKAGRDNIVVASDVSRAFQRIETAVEHECQHMAQVLLQRATGNESAGYPKPATSEPYDTFKEPEKYHQDAREFWPLLDSVAREMRLKLQDVPEADRSTALKTLIDDEPMLRTLRENDRPLWQKAVRELTKKLGPEGLAVRVAYAFAERHLG